MHRFSQEDLEQAWATLAPEGQVDLVVIGCPQAGLEEIRRTASEVRARAEVGHRIPDQRLWIFTSSETKLSPSRRASHRTARTSWGPCPGRHLS